MPTKENVPGRELLRAGLCASCQHARCIESSRGSQFILCWLAATDPAFPKYPQLPVAECAGYAERSW
jgi:hypothetical protein